MNCSSNDSSSGSPGETTAANWTQPVDRTWDVSLSEKTSLTLFLLFLVCALFSLTANGLLFFLTVRCKQLWQPQYILLSNIAACGFGRTLIATCVVLSSVVRNRAQLFGSWCIVQFCILRVFFLMSQTSLALMAVERYIFICHGIHYLRLIHTSSMHIGLGLLWLLSWVVSVHGGLVLNQMKLGLQQHTNPFPCDAISIKELLTPEENLQLFVPSSVITAFCILTTCCCYGCMYRAALRVSAALKCNNHRANCTVGLYLLMLLLQTLPSVFFIMLVVMGETKSPTLRILTPLLTHLLFTIPPCVTAAFLLLRNPQIKELLFTVCRQQCPWTEVEVLQQGPVELEEENPVTPPPLPGSAQRT
ncbi:olfactory receptor 7G1-like [Platichthys flesus]|uniref:olfactory receptor 7G1-like n=1 Tax=Platichthys flesus TaxID=8260 RepID=UPI002DB76329|nr:olfactory receptor 7G1-like [Platichthys flesus]